jgi:uncharacterized membrane protein YjjP (DUF1212 family)
MKDQPEIVTAIAAFIGSIMKAIKIKLNWRSTVASVILATVIGYLMPGLVDYFLPDANRQLIIVISILAGFLMHSITDYIEEYLKNRFNVNFSNKDKKK